MSDCGCNIEIKDQSQKSVLYWLLAINASMFFSLKLVLAGLLNRLHSLPTLLICLPMRLSMALVYM